MKDLHFHDLRHTFASRLVMKGVDLRRVQEFLGHKSIQTTERYSHLVPEQPVAAVGRLDGPAPMPGLVPIRGQDEANYELSYFE